MRQPLARARWLQRICRRLVRLFDLCVTYRGDAAESGVLVSNHVSYLDVVVFAARHPMLFVAKKEVRSWPVIGWVAACAGTIFIDRSRRADVTRVSALMTDAIAQGVQVCIFPEGTSSDGSRVLPFRTSLLEPVVAGAWPVTAAWVGYALEDGRAETQVCYWGEMKFTTHFLRLLGVRRIFGSVAYAPLARRRGCRKDLGNVLHSLVSRLSAQRPSEA
jgi:1-acyl-sn-glycerol-3-phosphate acyltransferase